ncbi:hypothetical protein SODG_000326 [Sodalis praecaptivus]
MGSWSAAGRADQSVTLLEGIRHAVGDKAKVLYARGANITDHQDLIAYLNQYEQTVKVDPRTPQAMIDDAVRTARQADVVIAAVGKRRVWPTKPPAAAISPSRKANAGCCARSRPPASRWWLCC